jgi:hypothetical protein
MLLTAVENESPGLPAYGQRFEGNQIAFIEGYAKAANDSIPFAAHEHS